MRVLGIDPGSRMTGFGLIDAAGAALRHIESGCIETPGDALARRLHAIYRSLSELLERCRPDAVAVERVFFARNAHAALTLGQARGAAICAAANHGAAVFEYTALQIKQAVVGRGHAGKEQVQHMVRALLALEAPPPADAADALACAICHAHTIAGRAHLSRRATGAPEALR